MSQRIIDQEDNYIRWRSNHVILSKKTPDPSVKTYADVIRQQMLEKEEEKMHDPSVRTYANVMRPQPLEKKEEETLKDIAQA
ncbi:hypothetical protein ACOSP7_002704 [Xanthoceras sorbifolium]